MEVSHQGDAAITDAGRPRRDGQHQQQRQQDDEGVADGGRRRRGSIGFESSSSSSLDAVARAAIRERQLERKRIRQQAKAKAKAARAQAQDREDGDDDGGDDEGVGTADGRGMLLNDSRRGDARGRRRSDGNGPRGAESAFDAAASDDDDDDDTHGGDGDGDALRCSISSGEYFGAVPGFQFPVDALGVHGRAAAGEKAVLLALRVATAVPPLELEGLRFVGKPDTPVTADLFNYFCFPGSDEEAWDARLYARAAYEGFFTITHKIPREAGEQAAGKKETPRRLEPLHELQPFYSVVTWDHFDASKFVRQHLRRLQRLLLAEPGPGTQQQPPRVPPACHVGMTVPSPSAVRYRLRCSENGQAVWDLLDAYQKGRQGSNWLTEQYLAMMRRASADPSLNFQLVTIELHEEEVATAVAVAGSNNGCGDRPNNNNIAPVSSSLVAGEIGYVVGRVYTSLSGFSARPGDGTGSPAGDSPSGNGSIKVGSSGNDSIPCESSPLPSSRRDHVGTTQLVLLGRWLQQRGYSFWSLGHCYSPEMDYKRRLGHRIYPRAHFLELLHDFRGEFDHRQQALRAPAGGGVGASVTFTPLRDGDEIDFEPLLPAARA